MNAKPSKALRLWDVIEVKDSEEIEPGLYRVVYQLPRIDKIYLFPLQPPDHKEPPKSGVPIAFSLNAILDLLAAGLIGLGEYVLPSYMELPEDKLEPTVKKKQNACWDAISSLISKDKYAAVTTDPEMRQFLIKEQATDIGRSERFLSRQLIRFWNYGGGRRAVRPHFDRCGGRGKKRKVTCKLGRPSRAILTGHDETRLGVNVTDAERKIIEDITRTKVIGLHWQINRAYDYFKDKYCVDTSISGNGRVIATPRSVHHIITPNQFYYHHAICKKQLEMQKLQAARDWDLKHRQLKSSARFGTFGPCDRFEIDATVANIWLVSRYDPCLIIGRPVVYLVCDTWSRFIVGVHVALEGPSWNTARMAVCNTLLNKLPFLQALGIEDVDENTWPAHDFCALLVSDRGEVLSKAAEHALQDGLNLNSAIASAGRGDMKAIVERRFGTLDTVLSWIPGAYRARALEALKASNYDPRCDARVNIVEFLRMVVEEILYFNNEQDYYGLMTPEMRRTGMTRPTPRNMFLWGCEHLTGREDNTDSQVRTPGDIYRTLLPYRDCSVTRQGIRFREGMHFTSPRLLDEEYFARRPRSDKESDDKKMRLYYEPFTLDGYIVNKASRQWEQVFLREADKARFANLTVNEVDDMLAIEALDRSDNADSKNKRRYGKTRRQEGMVEDAVRKQKEFQKATGRTLDKKNVKVNRTREATTESALNAKAFANYGVPKSSTRASATTRAQSPQTTPRAQVVDLMERLRKRR